MLNMPVMAKRDTSESDSTVPVTLRMRAKLRERAMEYAKGFRFPPTLTEVIEAAMEEYLERHEGDQPKPPKR